jgi:hypothetical protein
MVLLWRLQGQTSPQKLSILILAATGSFLSSGFLVVFQLLPLLRHLRYLRTLPISATRLALIIVAIVTLPLVALGALAAAVAWLTLGAPAALPFLNSYTFILAPASLCAFIAVWRGDRMEGCALLIVTIFAFLKMHGWLQISVYNPAVPFDLIGPIAAVTVLLAILLTRRALVHSSHAYRVRANVFGNFPAAMGR